MFILLCGCAEYNSNTKKQDMQKIFYYSNGFALIYEDKLYDDGILNKKINNNELDIIHSFLKINTLVEITNPLNSKSILAKVKKNADYPKIFNIVISKEIASLLDLDFNNPYIQFFEVKINKTFIAKKGNIFDEEKNVAQKVPVDEIKVDDLSKSKIITTTQIKKKSSYFLIVNDFYYLDTANNLKNNLIKKTKLKNLIVKKINSNKFRLSAGPFLNFNALKSSYISLNNLGFDDLDIYKE